MCVKPITLKRRLGNITRDVQVPCGCCPECLKKKQSAYVCRCIEEAKKLGRVWFITLTYSQENCPKVKSGSTELLSLRREDVKKWKREVRRTYLKKYGVPFPKFSFLICGEYGSRTHRPHYHGFLCGLDLKHAQILEKYWQDTFGFTVFKPISLLPTNNDDISCVARYVAKYCVKPEGFKNRYKDIIENPRIMTSPNFGVPDDFERYKNYLRAGLDLDMSGKFSFAQVSKINNRCKYTYNGCNYSLPLYIRKKVFYEKNFKGNLSASKLQKLCSLALHDNSFEDLCRELRQMESNYTEREINEILTSFCEAERDNLLSRKLVGEKDLQSDYRSDKF